MPVIVAEAETWSRADLQALTISTHPSRCSSRPTQSKSAETNLGPSNPCVAGDRHTAKSNRRHLNATASDVLARTVAISTRPSEGNAGSATIGHELNESAAIRPAFVVDHRFSGCRNGAAEEKVFEYVDFE